MSVVRALYTPYVIGYLLSRLVVVRGNLETMIKFMIHYHKVRKPELAPMFWEVQELFKEL